MVINMTQTDPALVCDPGALSPDQRRDHARLTAELARRMLGVDELTDGFAFRFPADSEIIPGLAGFIANERLCCPFLKFGLEIGPEAAPFRLSLTGPETVKDFLQAEFAQVFKSTQP